MSDQRKTESEKEESEKSSLLKNESKPIDELYESGVYFFVGADAPNPHPEGSMLHFHFEALRRLNFGSERKNNN